MRRFLSGLLDYTYPTLGGLAALIHALAGDDRLTRWLRTNEEHEPEPIS